MAIMNRDNFEQINTLRGIHMVIFNKWNQREAVGRGIFNVYESTQKREHTQTVGGVGIMAEKDEGSPIDYSSFNEGFTGTFTHLTYAMGLRATHEMMSDELYGVLESQGLELANSAHATEETVLSNHINNGTTAGVLGPDGVVLFSNSHNREDGGTYDNLLAASDLTATAIEAALIQFRNQRDGGGKRIQIKPETLLIPPDLQWTAQRHINSAVTPETNYGDDGVNRASGALNPVQGAGLQIVVWDYLTDTNGYTLLAGQDEHCLTLYDREPFNTDYIYDFDTGDYKIKGQFRQSSGWSDARGIMHSEGV